LIQGGLLVFEPADGLGIEHTATACDPGSGRMTRSRLRGRVCQ
jgi:hypothetical protein